jgi:hypothetical protein
MLGYHMRCSCHRLNQNAVPSNNKTKLYRFNTISIHLDDIFFFVFKDFGNFAPRL